MYSTNCDQFSAVLDKAFPYRVSTNNNYNIMPNIYFVFNINIMITSYAIS